MRTPNTALSRYAVVFEPADPPRQGRLAFWQPDAEGPALPDGDLGEAGELTVAVPHDGQVRLRTVAACRVSVGDALAVLRLTAEPHPAAAFWAATAKVALHLVARGRLLPGVTAGDFDAWRVGPLDADDVQRIQQLVAAMPAHARAAPVPGRTPMALPDALVLVRAFLDAVADVLPRTPAAVSATGVLPFAAAEPQRVPQLREWAREIGAGLDRGVRISLRVESAGSEEETGAEMRAVLQLHSFADPTLIVDAGKLWTGTDHGFSATARADAMLAVRRAAQVWPALARLLDRAVPDELELTDAEVFDLLGQPGADLAAAGVQVHWPKTLVRGLTAKAMVGSADTSGSDRPSFFGGRQLMSFNWQLALGGDPLTEAEMDRLAQAHRPVVRLRDQWVLLDADLAAKTRKRALRPLSAIDALGAALTGTVQVSGQRVEVTASGWLDELRQRIAEPDSAATPDETGVRQPAELAATLRDYQLRGLRWLARMTSLGLGGCLADDMGLGKTITLIALHLHRQDDPATSGPTLVVCPASLLGNWEREITRFAPGTPVQRFHGGDRCLDGATTGFVLTTYATMRLDAARLGAHRWGLLVADEAQHVKNPTSGTAKALRALSDAGGPAARVALTGTPVENNLSELWAILDWTTPGLLGSLRTFRTRWARPIESDNDAATAQRLSQLVRPFLLRRRKSDPGVAPELPAKTETDQLVALTQEQAALYEAVVRELMAQIEGDSGMARRGHIVKLLTGLKQICNHPAQYLKDPSARLAGRSGKLELLDELVDTIVAEGGAVLVFTQYVAMARIIERHLQARGLPTQLLHGGTPVRHREEMVRRFQNGEVPIFLLSLKAAGTGLNLTRADHVIHYDRWWNPAVEDQATDRAHRIGQTRPVQVHKLIAEGTVEDRIAAMLRSKRELAGSVLGPGPGELAALTELTDAELADLFELRSAQ